MDIANTVELLDFATGVLKDVTEAKADGSISIVEMVQLAIKEASPGIKAALGADQVVLEMKDLDASEIKLLAEKSVALANAAMAFFGK